MIDVGETDMYENKPVVYRDFDDAQSPVDGPDPPGEEDTLPERDMGADEYPTHGGFSYWWRKF